MATGKSGTYNISTANQYINGYVQWVETYDPDTYASTNQTTITQTAYLHRTNDYSGTTGIQGVSGSRTMYFGSESVANYDNLTLTIQPGGSYTQVYSASKTITHDDDGTKSVQLGFAMSNGAPAGSAKDAFTVSRTNATVTLTTIPRKANLLTAQNFTDLDNPTITYENPAGNSVSKLEAGIFNTAGSVNYVPYREVNKTGSLSYTFNLTNEEKAALRQACTSDSMGVRFYLYSKVGSSEFWTYLEKTFTLVNGTYVKVSDSWKEAIPYIKIDGTWKQAIPYIKSNGTWEKGRF